MKYCSGNYFPWEIGQEYINDDRAHVRPHPFCEGCEYIRTCAFRVQYWIEFGKDMPEEDVEIIHGMVNDENILKEQSRFN